MQDFKDSDIEGDSMEGVSIQQKISSPLKRREKTQPASKKLQVLSTKVYESDKDSGGNISQRVYSSDSAYFDADSDSLSDEESKVVGAVPTNCCSCFGVFGGKKNKLVDPSETPQQTYQKPHGLFGQKSFSEVCMEIAENDNFGGLSNK